MSVCPNINLPEWQALEKAVGRFEAYKDFVESGYEIRTVKEVQDKLNARRESITKAKVYPHTSGLMSGNLEEIGLALLNSSQPDIQNQAKKIANDSNVTRAMEIARKLSDSLGVSFDIISAERAKQITDGTKNPWSGQAAFYYGGQVYFVGESLSVNNVLHEFAHPLVRQIQVDNPALFQNLFEKLVSTPEGIEIINNVRASRPDLIEDGQMFQEEILVKGLERAAVNQIDQSPGFVKFIKDILFAIKKVLRNALGQIEVSKLDENTTLDQLAYMLTNDSFQIDTELITEEDVVAYVRDFQQEINDLKKLDKVQLQAFIRQGYDLASSQLRELQTNDKYRELALILRDQYKVPDMENIMTDLRKYKSAIDKIVEDEISSMELLEAQANALVSTVYTIDNVMKKIQIHMDDLYKTGDSQSNMAKAHYYDKVVKYWAKYISELQTAFNKPGSQVDADALIQQAINRINTNIKKIDEISDAMSANGARDALYSELEPIGRDIRARYEEIISNLKAKGAPQKIIDKWHTEYYGLTEDAYKRYSQLREKVRNNQYMSNAEQLEYANMRVDAARSLEITPEKIEDLLKGQLGDANWYSSYLEGYMSNPDPIVGGLAMYVKNRLNEVMARAQAKFNDFSTDIAQELKDYGYNPTNIGKLGKDAGFLDTVAVEEEGQLVQKKIWTFLNPFKDYRYELRVVNKKVEDAEKEFSETGSDASFAALTAAMSERKDFLRKYFHQEYKPEFYKRQALLERDDIGKLASFKRESILEKIRKVSALSQSEEEQLEATKEIDNLWREYRQLHSLYDLFGNKKTGTDLEVSKRLREYREQSREFYTFKPRPGVFQNILHRYEEELAAKYGKDSAEYKILRDEWIRKNTRVSIKPSFYARREEIFQRIKEILNTLPDAQKKEIDLADIHSAIIDIKAGFRDEDGQPNPSEMTEAAVDRVKRLEQELQERKKNYMSINGLNAIDQARLNELYSIRSSRDLTALESSELNGLYAKKSANQLNKFVRAELDGLYAELEEMSSTEATGYYIDIVNNYLQTMDTSMVKDKLGSTVINEQNANGLLEADLIDNLKKQNAEFAKWFNANHIEVEYSGGKKYRRVSVWSVVRPKDSRYLEKTEIKDKSGKVIETIEGLPSMKFYKQEVKDEYKTDLIVGKTIDNKGNFLPKSMQERDPGVDNKFINEEYERVKNTNPSLFNILEKLKRHHLQNQTGLDNYSKLYLDFPRFTMGKYETMISTDLTQYAKRAKEFFFRAKDDSEAGFNYTNQSNLVKLDMFDDEVTKVPISGLYNIDHENVSTDIITSMMRYMLSAERQKQLVEISPLARAIQKIVNKPESTVDLDKINKWNFVHRQIVTYKKKKGTSVRASAVNNFLEREFEGQSQKGIASESAFIQNLTNLLFKRASFQFFALNIPSALKNYYGAKYQTMIESSAGRYLNPISAGFGNAWAFKTMGELSFTNQLYKRGPKSLNVQLVELFDPSQGRFKEKFGESMSRTITSDVLEGSWLYSTRKWLELQSQFQVFGGMMHHVNDVERKMPDGTIQKIKYIDAWELNKDNKIQLKEGVDPKWGVTYDANGNIQVGAEFSRFKNKMQQVMNNLNGAYAEFDQPEAQRYVAFRMISYLRRYFTSMAIQRFGFKGPIWKASPRMNFALGEPHMGYYIQTLQLLKQTFVNFDLSFKYATKEQRMAAMRTLTEVALWIALFLIIRSIFGWDPDDDDKWDKLREAQGGPLNLFPFTAEAENEFNGVGFLKVHALNLAMQVQAENEQFLPVPGLGLDNYMELLDLKSIALGPTTDTWTQILDDLISIVKNDDDAYYTRDVGPYTFQQKESAKIWAKLAKMLGFNGTSIDPATAVKNFTSAQAMAK